MTSTGDRLLQEIQQQKPLRSSGQEAVIALFRTADALRRHVARVLEPHGITPQQYNVLRILRGAGAEGLPTLEIGERMLERAPGVTRLLDRMDARGWVRRERCPRDRRQVLCYATEAGLELLTRLDAPVDAADGAVVARLSAPERERLLELLDRVRRDLQPEGEESAV